MKRIIVWASVSLITVLFSVGCGVSGDEHNKLKSKYESLKTENSRIKKELADVKKELHELKFGPGELLKKARLYYDQKKFEAARIRLDKLMEKHPTAIEAKEARVLLANAKKEIEKLQLMRQQKEKKRIAAKKRELAQAIKGMRKSRDKVNQITFYSDRTSPDYLSTNDFKIYIGKKDNGYQWLCFRIQYSADDWLFIKEFVLSVDGRRYEIKPAFGEVKRDNASGEIWEWWETTDGLDYLNIIKAIADSKETILRCIGSEYWKDRLITKREKRAIKNVLTVYDVLKKKH